MSFERHAARVPLGYADLEEDEALIVSLYRQWRAHGPTPAIAEHRLAVLLRHDRLYDALEPVFSLFRCFAADPALADEESGILNTAETGLVELLAQPEAAEGSLSHAAHLCRRELDGAGISLRPAATIPRSGRDHLENAVARSYSAVLASPGHRREAGRSGESG